MTLELQLRCAQREVQKRRAVYPKLVSEGKLTEDRAATEIACMAAIVKTLTTQVALEQVSREIYPGTERLEYSPTNEEPLLI